MGDRFKIVIFQAAMYENRRAPRIIKEVSSGLQDLGFEESTVYSSVFRYC